MFRQSSATLFQQQQRRERTRSIGKEAVRGDEALDLFSTARRSVPVASPETMDAKRSTLASNLARISIGSAKSGRRGLEDLLSAGEKEKHDYDWLLTPPGSPLQSSLDSMEAPRSSAASRSTLSVRSASVTKTAKIIPQQTSNGRSNSRIPTRPAVERSGSLTRAAIHVARCSTPATGGASRVLTVKSNSIAAPSRPPTPVNRSTASQTTFSRQSNGPRPSTPVKTRPLPAEKAKPQTSSRPSTPTARPQLSLSTTRPSTPTRRLPSGGITSKPPTKPVPPPSLSKPIKQPERPVSAGRSRPRLPLSSSLPSPPPENVPRRNSTSPARSWPQKPENQKPAAAESGGFGRTVSKKSLDVAIRHMDIRHGMDGVRGAPLFPHSIRMAPQQQPQPQLPPPPPLREAAFLGRAIGRDVFESSRYDTILLKEDVRNMSWLHSAEDKHDHNLFELRLEPLPEPFVLL